MRRASTSQAPLGAKPSASRPAPEKRLSDDGDEFIRTKILLLGLRRSGKTSIQQVLFDGLSPKQAFFVEPSARLSKHKVDSFIPLEIWDVPGKTTVESLGVPLSVFTSIIFVIDIQDSYHHPIAHLMDSFLAAFQANQDVNLEIFVHKAEALSEDFRNESFRHIQARLYEELADLPPLITDPPTSTAPNSPTSWDPTQIPMAFHLTSVYDHSLQEAFGRVVHRILSPGCLPYLEGLLNAFCTQSHSTKAFLFDTQAKIYIATDNSPVDSPTFGLCCDYVHMLNEFGGLYKSAISSPSKHPRRCGVPPDPPPPVSSSIEHSLASSPTSGKGHLAQSPQSLSAVSSRSTTPTHTASGPPPTSPKPVASSKSSPSTKSSIPPKSTSSPSPPAPSTQEPPPPATRKPLFYQSSSATLTPQSTILYQQITPRLALVAVLPTSVWETKRGLVEYNVVFLREGVQEIYEVEQDSRRRKNLRTPDPPPVTTHHDKGKGGLRK